MLLYRIGCPYCDCYFSVARESLNKNFECHNCEKVFFIEDYFLGDVIEIPNIDEDCGLGYDSCEACDNFSCECNDFYEEDKNA